MSDIKDPKRTARKLKSVATGMQRTMRGSLVRAGKSLQETIRRSLRLVSILSGKKKLLAAGPARTGRLTRLRGTKKGWYVASAPGEPPVSPTGKLANAVGIRVIDNGSKVTVGIHPQPLQKMAQALEFGNARLGGKRPFVQRGFDKDKEKIRARLRKAADKGLKKTVAKLQELQ